MDQTQLRAAQAPLKEQYRQDPDSARTPLRAAGRIGSPGVTFDVDQFAGVSRAGLHRATGGDGTDACSGDMLLEALLACAGVTLNSVATATGIQLRSVEGTAEGFFDARGTLGVDREAPIGVQNVVVTFLVDTDAEDAALDRLAKVTERYCVVGRSLADPPEIVVRRR
ncbi:OsmC family protein [Nocardia asteroides]|uniref:OsmC family protein n=1 Tax=Nocardia asteroides TaxID=1824 RepID=UPI0037C9E1E5